MKLSLPTRNQLPTHDSFPGRDLASPSGVPARKGASSESGYILLFVYAMAATIAITLYMELPRAAFEAQRDREQLLIDRGEQYSRAITLYVRKFQRYPANFDALDNTQNLRFLRKRYVDPFTGKDDWRVVHVGPGGVFIDSLVYNKKKDPNAKEPEAQNFITELQQTGGNQVDPNQGGVNLATRQRPSDQPGAPGDPNNPQQAGLPQQPGVVPAGFSQPPGVVPGGLPQQLGFAQAGFAQAGMQPGIAQQGIQPSPQPQQFDANGQPIPAQPAVPLPPGVQVPPGGQLPGFPPTPGAATQAQFADRGFQPQQFGANGANSIPPTGANMINQLLTTPRPGGLNGLGGQPQTPTPPGGIPGVPVAATATQTPVAQTIGGGIAGIASTRTQEGIKVYKDKKKYNEWEFVYDVTKDPTKNGGAGQIPAATQTGNPASPQQQQQIQQMQQGFQQAQQQQQQPQPPGGPPAGPPAGPPPGPLR